MSIAVHFEYSICAILCAYEATNNCSGIQGRVSLWLVVNTVPTAATEVASSTGILGTFFWRHSCVARGPPRQVKVNSV
jgi:hypothetical protein